MMKMKMKLVPLDVYALSLLLSLHGFGIDFRSSNPVSGLDIRCVCVCVCVSFFLISQEFSVDWRCV